MSSTRSVETCSSSTMGLWIAQETKRWQLGQWWSATSSTLAKVLPCRLVSSTPSVAAPQYVATFDADGQHHAADLSRMIDALRSGAFDIVLGSRFLGHAESMPASRRLLLRAAVLLTRLTTGVTLTDAHNGLRVMTAVTARRLRLFQNRMAHASELVAQIGRLGLRVTEVPVTISYTRYSLEKGQRLTDSVRILVDLFAGWLLR